MPPRKRRKPSIAHPDSTPPRELHISPGGPVVTTPKPGKRPKSRRAPTARDDGPPRRPSSAEADAAATLAARGGRRLRKQRVIPEPDFTRRATYTTWFRAIGTVGKISDFRPRGAGKSPDLMHEVLDDFAAPAAWASNQSGLLGRVKYDGIVPLDVIIDDLNIKLQFVGEEIPNFDFRLVYPRWRYKYEIFETIGPTTRSLQRIQDERPRRR